MKLPYQNMTHIKQRKGEIEIYKSISLALCPKYSIIENIFIQNGENCILVLLLF